jgi:hypothetical protein
MKFLLPTLFLTVISVRSTFLHHHHGNHFNDTIIDQLEDRGEAYLQSQIHDLNNLRKVMRGNPNFINMFNHLYPCILGITPVGADNEAGISDGHKFVCGLSHVTMPAVIYSFGSFRDDGFERALLALKPNVKIFIFELKKENMVREDRRHPDITYLNYGLGKTRVGFSNMKTMKEIMIEFNHSYVDIVKMDIEHGEDWWIKNEGE